jgi:hypothetical protein
MEMPITLIWSLYNVYMYSIIILWSVNTNIIYKLKNIYKKNNEGVAQVVEVLPSKQSALSLISSTAKNK